MNNKEYIEKAIAYYNIRENIATRTGWAKSKGYKKLKEDAKPILIAQWYTNKKGKYYKKKTKFYKESDFEEYTEK